MFKWIMDGWNSIMAWWVLLRMLRDPFYAPIVIFLRDTLSNSLWKDIDEEYKARLCQQILAEVTQIFQSSNPCLSNRQYLSDWMVETASFGVLILPPFPEKDTTGFRGKPGITGILKKHIGTLFKEDKTLKKIAWNENVTAEADLHDLVVILYLRASLRVSIANLIRIELKDHHPDKDKDWLLPFAEIMYACFENPYRKTLGIDSVLEKETMDPYAELKYSAFINFVLRGDENPYYTWMEELKIGHSLEEMGRSK